VGDRARGLLGDPRADERDLTHARRAHALLAFCALVAACGDGEAREPTPPPPGAAPFAYDRSRPLELVDRGRVNRKYPIAVRDVSYSSQGRRVDAFLVLPPGRGPFPAVVFAHGSGQDRLALLAHATWIAARGAVALAVDQRAQRAGRAPAPDVMSALRRERERTARAVVDFRRAVDLLQSLPQVDGRRVGFVGLSAGARLGAVLAGVERRVDAYVLMSGGASPVDDYLEPLPADVRPAAAALLRDVDPLAYVGRSAPAALLFQNGLRDEIVPRDALEALAAAGSEPKDVRWYDAGHDLSVRAFREQLDWLERRLGIEGPPVRGAVTGP
jgi:dienelactone hydrolase